MTEIVDAWKVGRGTVIATDMVREGSEDVHYHVVVLREDQIARIADAVMERLATQKWGQIP